MHKYLCHFSTTAGKRKRRDNAESLVETLPDGMQMYINGGAVDFNTFVEERKKSVDINPTRRQAKARYKFVMNDWFIDKGQCLYIKGQS